jgi:AAA domain
MFKQRLHRDEVFVAGGQPSVTYVDRQEFHVERNLARAIAAPNQVASLAGPTKTGKTVLCRKVLGEREYVWIDAGEVTTIDSLWASICSELNIPDEITSANETTNGVDVGYATPITARGSRLRKRTQAEKRVVNSVSEALDALTLEKTILVIDDFHYLSPDTRIAFMRNVKGAVFNGLKVLLLSVTHRAFDAIKAESELTGRFISIVLPNWTLDELKQIPRLGFTALVVAYKDALITQLAQEAQDSPFLMQKFCWEICFDCGIEYPATLLTSRIIRLARDAGLPIYQKLVAGPQSRKARTKRPLKSGGEADIYEATLIALAETGPKPSVSYDDLRSSLNCILANMMPQKHEITSALKHLAAISMKVGTEAAIDWDEDKREVNLADPYLRFFLRWQVRATKAELPLLAVGRN